MRYDKEHKEQTRQRIVETASRRFREHGIEAEGVKSLMSASGLTNGAFYNHFASKEDLAREAVTAAMDERVAYLRRWIASGEGLQGMIESYFSIRHRDNPGRGCPTTVLAAEIARHSDDVRTAYTEGMLAFVELAATQWPALPADEAMSRAMSLYGLMAGTMQLARATSDARLSGRILESGRRAALAMVGSPP
ncbi:TetR/AcrR family transcriptional regulator [Luteibacter sp. 3190]|uniref:TetR/AcrR family transcriptional regulator n=1 Tax=Luteibacter sp. 3190 TaxID=2817736 RepID=UPI002854F8EA|nr:TetR/AcrR family transcriptional regulator [Luteibacter sp. 3190]MDR6937435.1 TetR/AcrR family transcriptional repressor of nem operon [Luteibacter sp. 3190]